MLLIQTAIQVGAAPPAKAVRQEMEATGVLAETAATAMVLFVTAAAPALTARQGVVAPKTLTV